MRSDLHAGAKIKRPVGNGQQKYTQAGKGEAEPTNKDHAHTVGRRRKPTEASQATRWGRKSELGDTRDIYYVRSADSADRVETTTINTVWGPDIRDIHVFGPLASFRELCQALVEYTNRFHVVEPTPSLSLRPFRFFSLHQCELVPILTRQIVDLSRYNSEKSDAGDGHMKLMATVERQRICPGGH